MRRVYRTHILTFSSRLFHCDSATHTTLALLKIRSQSRKQSRRGKSKEEKVKMCVRYTLLIANSLLALLGLLLLAGGVWRIVDNESLREVANEIKDTQEWDDVKEGVDGLEDAVKEASSHKYFNYALLAMGGITLLVQIAAIVFINFDDANIDFIKKSISTEAEKIDIDVERLNPGSKFIQNLFFGVSAGLSAIILFFTVTLCCRARREERVQGYVDAIQA